MQLINVVAVEEENRQQFPVLRSGALEIEEQYGRSWEELRSEALLTSFLL